MKWLKGGAIVFMSVLVTSLAIDAADTVSGVRSSLLGQLVATDDSACPAGMVSVQAGQTFSCVDMFEVAPGADCPFSEPKNHIESTTNVNSRNCMPVSAEKTVPWRFISREQAQTACLKAGKRLLTAPEWFMVAAGTPDDSRCNVDSSGPQAADSFPECTSALGIANAVGNVWEWVSSDVIEGVYENRQLPEEGYVTQVDAAGLPTLTNKQSSGLFGDDYFWADQSGAYAILRGGFYGSQSDAGVYAVHANTEPTSVSTAIGFRCAF